jgi:hypothetical protein
MDRRWLWLQAAVQRLYSELDADQIPDGLTLVAVSPDGSSMSYTVVVGRDEVLRMAVTDADALLSAAACGLTDATPPATAEGLG